jgi:hypothetical protein
VNILFSRLERYRLASGKTGVTIKDGFSVLRSTKQGFCNEISRLAKATAGYTDTIWERHELVSSAGAVRLDGGDAETWGSVELGIVLTAHGYILRPKAVSGNRPLSRSS